MSSIKLLPRNRTPPRTPPVDWTRQTYLSFESLEKVRQEGCRNPSLVHLKTMTRAVAIVELQKVVNFHFPPDFPLSFLLSFRSGSNKYPVQRSCGGGAEDAEERTQMATTAKGMGADWATDASSFSHIFIPTSSSGDSCYLGIEANECKQTSGNRLKCVACRIVIHVACASSLNDRFTCRPSFCESVRKYREFTAIPHHWVQRKQLKVSCNIIFGNNHRLGFQYCLSSHVDI